MMKRLKLIDLIDSGVIETPLKIHGNFKGKHFNAEIDKDGFVLLNGKRYTSLSLAAGAVRAEISGKPADGMPYRRANGWTFWKMKTPEGMRALDHLRQDVTDASRN